MSEKGSGGSMERRGEAINEVLRRPVDRQEVPGVVAMAADDRGLIYEGAFGVRRLGDAQTMTLDTVFRIQSMTKAVTSVAAMQLVEQGKLALDEPVPAIDEKLSALRVLTGFDTDGQPLGQTSDNFETPADPHRWVRLQAGSRSVRRRRRAEHAVDSGLQLNLPAFRNLQLVESEVLHYAARTSRRKVAT
jgi:hypothetical protein